MASKRWIVAGSVLLFSACAGLPSDNLTSPADQTTVDDTGESGADTPSDAPGDALGDVWNDISVLTDGLSDLIEDSAAGDAETDVPLTDALVTDTSATDVPGAEDSGWDGGATDTVLPGDVAACDCGDGTCNTTCGENLETCPADCKGCGNGVCEPGEGPKSCSIDCCGACGDGKCKGYDCGESAETCAKDCGNACGNKVCDKGESPSSCAQDCAWQVCGNGMCESTDGGPAQCPEDCGTACGDGACESGEDFITCPIDCGYCGDGICSVKIGEGSANCMVDCKGGECDPELPSDVTKCDDGNPCTMETCPPSGTCHHPPIPGDCDDGSICTIGDHCVFGACELATILDCSDDNPCTTDLCDGQLGCKHLMAGGACTDGNACTLGDSCKDGACSSGVALDCEDGNPCTLDACDVAAGCTATTNDQSACSDGNLCTSGDHCAGGVCASTGDLACDDGNPCSNDLCLPESGCAHLPNTVTCSDGNACTAGDLCINAVCTPGSAVECNDGNPCTADGCNVSSGCSHKPTSSACDDANPCTTSDTCKGGTCQGGPDLDCDDGNGCTSDACDPAVGCTSTAADGAACSDGSVCSAGDGCVGGACVAGDGLPCDDGNPCTQDGCNASAGCNHKALNGACEDGNPCTSGDACFNAVCMPGAGLDCGDGNPCTLDACDASGACHHTASTGACTDGNACSIGDTCQGGSCQPGGALDCDDGNPCTDENCSAANGCVHLPGSATCSDGNACTVGDVCANTVCTPGGQVDCNDDDPCTSDSCQAQVGCQHKATAGACDDGDLCTVADTCKNGVCQGGGSFLCDDGNGCTFDQCDSATGCISVAADGNGCSDGNVCTASDTCQDSACVGSGGIACDDGNPCTLEGCSAQTGCTHLATLGPCQDGNACTTGDGCANGVCVSGALLNCNDDNPCTADTCAASTGCQNGPTTLACTDGDACTSGDACKDSVCVPGATFGCDDGNPCTDDACNPATGCVHLPGAATCSDNNACTVGDTCINAVCTPGVSLACSDGNSCTADSCSGVDGCVHVATSGICSDGDACTLGDTCQGGGCSGTMAQACDDGNPCSIDGCDAVAGCTHLPASGTCTDGNACTLDDACVNNVCASGSLLDCNDDNPCTVDSCAVASGCVHKATTAACDDANPCTVADTCKGGTCVAGASQDCDDGNGCTSDTCDPATGCSHDNDDGAACSDGNVCTAGDLCQSGACQPGAAAAACDDGNPCTQDDCNGQTGCGHKALLGPCEDGNACSTGDTCFNGVCTPGSGINCSDGNPCTLDNCDTQGGCTHIASSGACSDGDACSLGDSCKAGVCTAGTSLDCGDGNPCSDDSCDSLAGCVHLPNAATCSDGNACTGGDGCANSVCTSGAGIDCNDDNPCTADSCLSQTGCQHKPTAAACDDGNPCTSGDTCKAGVCQGGVSLTCDDGNGCTTDACDATLGCTHVDLDGAACSDGSVCTTGETCQTGACGGGSASDCNDGNPCTADACNGQTGCSHAAQSGGCDDGNACTVGDTCWNAVCTGGSPKDCSDSLVCTADSCDAAVGCKNVATTAPCSDGNACTLGDTCAAGACVPGSAANCADGNPCTDDACDGAQGCGHTANTATCTDSNACTVGDGCQGGSCLPGAQQGCDDGLACTIDACAAATGCSHTATTGACNDGDVCTTGDTCAGGVCSGGSPLGCDDANPCTVNLCNSKTGCYVEFDNAASCTDGNACTTGDHCTGGNCLYSTALGCDDGLPCTVDACNTTTGCTHSNAATGASCDDGNLCTTGDNCQAGVCTKTADLGCEDGLTCTTGSCVPASGCVQTPNSAVCTDGNPCTTGDHCTAGECAPTGLVNCDDGESCTADSCNTSDGGCVHAGAPMNGSACSDGSLCTPTDACLSGACVGSGTLACSDSNACTDDACAAASGCSHTPRTGSCDDGNPCTLGDACQGGTCAATSVKVCNDNNACTSDSCDIANGACVYNTTLLNGTLCSDGNLCSQTDTCSAGTCVGGNPVACSAQDQCHTVGTCAPATGVCSNPLKSDGTACNDTNACTAVDTCAAGVCIGTGVVNCNDSLACTADSCDTATGCKHDAPSMNGVGCNDGDGCTQTDTCSAGSCVGGNAVVCTAADQCHVAGACSSGVCSNPAKTDGSSCNDGSVCTSGDRCVSGACSPTGVKSCDDSLPCTNDSCDPALDCQHTPNTGNACNDGIGCTVNDTCASGTCTGAANCDDQNACTTDTCHATAGCQYASMPSGTPCGDFGNCAAAVCACPGGLGMVNQHCPPVVTSIAISGTVLAPVFSAGVTAYTATVALGTVSPSLTVTTLPGVALTLSVNGAPIVNLASGQASATPLHLGSNTLVIKAIFGGLTTSYAVTVTRLPTVQQAYVKSGNDWVIEGSTTSDTFGDALALSNDTLVVGSSNAEDGLGHVDLYERSGTAWQFVQTLYPLWSYDNLPRFGTSVALDGDIMVVGAPSDDNNPELLPFSVIDNQLTDSGAAYVYHRENGQWTLRTVLKASNACAGAGFGRSVAVAGDTIAVGADGEDDDPAAADSPWNALRADSGAVYVFTQSQGIWTERARIKPTTLDVGDRFGAAVALSGNTLAASAPGDDSKASGVGGSETNNGAPDSGAVFVFAGSAATWTQQAFIKPSNTDSGDGFGTALALSADTLVVGAPGEDGDGTDPLDNSRPQSGAAYVVVRAAGAWAHQRYLKSTFPDAGDAFGATVAADVDHALVGVPHESGSSQGINGDASDNLYVDSGAAFLFSRSAGTWSLAAYLKASNTDSNDKFGTAVAYYGNTAAAGAPGEAGSGVLLGGDPSLNDAPGAGAVYIFSGDVCPSAAAAECDDGDPCTTDTCDAMQYCHHAALAMGSTCGSGATCQATGCACAAGWLLWNGACRPGLLSLSTSLDAFAPNFMAGGHAYYGTHWAATAATVGATAASGISLAMTYNEGGGSLGASFPLRWGVTPVRITASSGANAMVYDLLIRRPVTETYIKAGTPVWSNNFGAAVAMDGDTLAVSSSDSSCATGVNGSELSGACSGAGGVHVYVRDGQGNWSQQAYLKASNTAAGDAFSSIAIAGDTIVVGAPGEDSGATGVNGNQADNTKLSSGAVYVFVRSGTSWSQQAYIKASTVDAGDAFGVSVALAGNTLVVGASGEDSAALNVGGSQTDNTKAGSGAAYVFVRSGTTWTQTAYMKSTNTAAGDAFGLRVAVSPTAVLGQEAIAVGALPQGSGAGAVYVYSKIAGVWTGTMLKAANAEAGDHFGYSVSFSGSTLLVGAPDEDSAASTINGDGTSNSSVASGAAYVFVYSGLAWTQQAYLKAPNTGAGDAFGHAVGLSGDYAVVCAPYEDGGSLGVNGNLGDNASPDSGACYTFQRNGTAWSFTGYFKASNTGANDVFGRAVGLSGTRLVVGADLEDGGASGINGNGHDNSMWASGAAYALDLNYSNY